MNTIQMLSKVYLLAVALEYWSLEILTLLSIQKANLTEHKAGKYIYCIFLGYVSDTDRLAGEGSHRLDVLLIVSNIVKVQFQVRMHLWWERLVSGLWSLI